MSTSTFTRPFAQRARRLARRINGPLVVGGLLVATLVICAAAAPLLAPFDPYEPYIFFNDGTMAHMPYPPGSYRMVLGSDSVGRDLLSRLIFGSRFTLLFCGVAATLRILLGTLLGMIGGWYARAGRMIDIVVSVWSAIPSLIFVLVPLLIVGQRGSLTASIVVAVVTLSLTGWSEAAIHTKVTVQSLQNLPFVEAAYTIGLSRWAVLWRHVLPNLRDVLLVEGAFAMASALLLIAELGFLNIFIGAAERDVVGVFPVQAEWGGMLARGLREQSRGFWLLLAPMAAFLLAILAFNLLAEGLRRLR
jgi:peptide/nickel transport system permease protein